MDDAERRRKIRDFTFDRCKRGNQGFERILLQLFGYVGHGKSSLINTVMCVWYNSRYKNCANAAGTDESHTTERLTYAVNKKIIMVDNRGCSSMNTYETGEIFAQLGNLLPLDMSVGWSKGFELVDRIVEAEPYVKASDFIIPIFVYSVRHSPTPELKNELRGIFETARQLTMVVPTVVLTHMNHPNYTEVENMFRDIGTETFFALENYTEENPRRIRETDESVIQFLYEVINDAYFRADHRRDADQEMIDRKLFVLNYIHNRELMIQKINLERQRNVEKIRIAKDHRLKQEEEEKQRQKCQKLHRERMERLQQEFERQRLQAQYEHEERMRQLGNKKGKNNYKK
ncbi:uncharacterized protein RB166_016086 [Leptodactylus fuscus]|uniref:uncharacterized protein LOC142216756 n=1 Tax=Leptodactylus fuscus TaxID=238119 RepID=UPI003F4E69FE